MKEHNIDVACYVSKYPGEFTDGDSGYIYCLLCEQKILLTRKVALMQHIRSAKHEQNRLVKLGWDPISGSGNNFSSVTISSSQSKPSRPLHLTAISDSTSEASRPEESVYSEEENQNPLSIETEQPNPESVLESNMLNSSELGLMPVLQKDESRDCSLSPPHPQTALATANVSRSIDVDEVAVRSQEDSNSNISHKPTSTAAEKTSIIATVMPSLLSAPKYLDQLTSSLGAPATPPPSSSMAQLKRKRGRPRKFTLSGFPPQLPASNAQPRPRLSLPTAAFNTQSNTSSSPSALSTQPLPNLPSGITTTTTTHTSSQPPSADDCVSSPIMKPPSKKTRVGRPPKSSYQAQHQALEVGCEATASEVSITTSTPSPPLPTPSIGPLASRLTTTTEQSPFPPMLTTPSGTSALVKPFLIDCYSNLFAAGGAAPSKSQPPTFRLPVKGNNSANINNNGSPSCYLLQPEGTLIGRLLPQAEAAVCAAKAAGLAGPHMWTSQMVAAFVSTLPGCQSLAPVFVENEIDGPALLCLEQLDLMSVLKLKLGPAVKIFGAIRALRQTMLSLPLTEVTSDHPSIFATAVSCFAPLPSSSSSSAATASAFPIKPAKNSKTLSSTDFNAIRAAGASPLESTSPMSTEIVNRGN